jgi:hypothetical protein
VLVVAQQGERVQRLEMPIQLEAGRRQMRLVPDSRRRETDVRVARQQGFAAGGALARHGPGVAAFKGWRPGVVEHLPAGLCHAVQRLPVVGRECRHRAGRRGVHTLGVPFEIEHPHVGRTELVADGGHHRFGTQCRREAVGQVPRDGHHVLGREGASGDAEYIELDGWRVAGLELVDAIQVGLQCQVGGAAGVEGLHVRVGMGAQAQGAEQAVDIQQLGTQHLGQFAACQAARHLHLEQAVLGDYLGVGARRGRRCPVVAHSDAVGR